MLLRQTTKKEHNKDFNTHTHTQNERLGWCTFFSFLLRRINTKKIDAGLCYCAIFHLLLLPPQSSFRFPTCCNCYFILFCLLLASFSWNRSTIDRSNEWLIHRWSAGNSLLLFAKTSMYIINNIMIVMDTVTLRLSSSEVARLIREEFTSKPSVFSCFLQQMRLLRNASNSSAISRESRSRKAVTPRQEAVKSA